ncbi:MAG: carboxypeptidase-like regulatory domain-containing protein [Chitinophagaceae bacterium]
MLVTLCKRHLVAFLVILLLLPDGLIAQSIPVTGKITSAKDGNPLGGISVIVKESNSGTVTDEQGNFRLNVPDKNSTLVISYVGFSTQEVNVRNRATIDIILEEADKKLDEVVVIGYGQQKRRDITGAISSVSAKALSEVPVNSPAQALQGRVAGLYAVTQGYRPGSDVTIRIRGNRSFSAGNDPLYVLDGIPLTGGINDINPNDIESMEVLKDASATAIYGSRGANGVIIITTRRGKSSKPVVTYDGYVGVVKPLGRVEILNGEEYAEYKRESRRASGNTGILIKTLPTGLCSNRWNSDR